MKKWLTCFLSLISVIFVFSQNKNTKEVSDQLIPDYYSYINYPKDIMRRKPIFSVDSKYWGETQCDGGKCKDGFYKKIEFTIGKTKVYASGELKKYKSGGTRYKIVGDFSFFYAENDQLLFSGKNNEDGYFLNKDGYYVLYQENGKKLIEVTKIIDANRNFTNRIIMYDEQGKVLADFETYETSYNFNFLGEEYKHLEQGYLRNYGKNWGYFDHISVTSSEPSNISHGDKGSYSGFNHIGIYNHPSGKKITGFILPVLEENGNGSVVYVNDIANNESYYCVYFNGQLDTNYKISVPQIEAEKFISDLHDTTDYLHFHALNQKFNVVNIKSKNLATYNGYGINYTTKVPKTVPLTYTKYAEIGFFKEGKLNGIGYRVSYEPINSEYKISYEYGFFENGVLKDGKSHASKGYWWMDFWNPIDIAGINYSVRKKHRTIYPVATESVPLSSLKVDGKTSIYIGAIERWATLTAIDLVKKSLEIKTKEGEVATIYMKDEPHLSTVISAENSLQRCKGCNGKGEIIYKEYHTEYVRKGSTQEGIYYTHYYSYSYPKTVEELKIGVCGACQGKGKREYKNTEVVYLLTPISF